MSFSFAKGSSSRKVAVGSCRSTSGLDAVSDSCTKRRDNAHKVEELEVLYRWHPWFGRVVHVHEVIEAGVLHCSPDGDASRRCLELPKWMFDRATCLRERFAAFSLSLHPVKTPRD